MVPAKRISGREAGRADTNHAGHKNERIGSFIKPIKEKIKLNLYSNYLLKNAKAIKNKISASFFNLFLCT